MFFGYPYIECGHCGKVTDEWAGIVEKNEDGKPVHKIICFDCADKLHEEKKEGAADSQNWI